MATLLQDLETALAQLKQYNQNWASLSATNKDAAQRLVLQSVARLIFQALNHPDDTP